jgi:enamine deaminase RidA (YjgF/YER057c/UK114 family)
MRTQIEQVGRNVGVCLQAARATVDNIVSTTSFVATPAEFDKHADLLPRYFGLPSPASRTVRAAQLSSPDFLLEVEAVAVTK